MMIFMNETVFDSHRLPLIALASLFLTGIGGAAFYGWLRFGSSILIALEENGLSGCF